MATATAASSSIENTEAPAPRRTPRPRRRDTALSRFPARPAAAGWPGSQRSRREITQMLGSAPFLPARPSQQQHLRRGLALLLDWLEDQPGSSWQERWLATGADAAGLSWRPVSSDWLRSREEYTGVRQAALACALRSAICGDVIRPSLSWLVSGATGKGALVRGMASSRDPQGFARLRVLAEADPSVNSMAAKQAMHRASLLLAAKGGMLADVTIGDLLELLGVERVMLANKANNTNACYRLLRAMGIFGEQAPTTLRELGTTGQRSPEELIDRYQIACRPVRDLLVEYLKERQPTLDYGSLDSLSFCLGKLFWGDIERHHPGIDSLNLPAEVAGAWKQRLQIRPATVTTPAGDKVEVQVTRINYRECLTPVRAFYLDLAHWAVEDPARWGRWVAPSPVGSEEINRRKAKRQHKSRMDARTRERLPVLPTLVAAVHQQHENAEALLETAQDTPPGQAFTTAGLTLVRSIVPHATAGKIWAEDPVAAKRRDLGLEEDRAFWTSAIVEVLRATGIRVEELLELSHHSLIQYRLPTTGEVVPLLQIAPSKTDAERLLLVSPELADVLSAIICRIRDRGTGAVPLVPSYDTHECVWRPPAPLLFQRRVRGELHAMTPGTIRRLLTDALAGTGLLDSATGQPLHYTPHDFRRLFITDAILNGLPPHIAQVIAGHRDINVTLAYKAVYPDEAIQAHLAFLARRRALRPTDEYRVPTDQEWQEFLGHFELRKVATGTCGRAFGSPCIHEHSCLRCPLHWPSPGQRHRIAEIRDNLTARIAEAEREGWLGEVEGLKVSLAGAEDKLAQIDRRSRTTIDLGIPVIPVSPQPRDRV
jgi:Phage integrase family